MKTFLSSTYTDLIEHRENATGAIERLGQQVGRMEVFGARPEELSITCFEEIEKCDLFVGVYAYRYGHIPEQEEISITEAELDYAIKHNKPAFCFFIDNNHPWLPIMVDEGDAKIKLYQFKNRIGKGLVRDIFTTPEDSAYKIASALGRYLSNSRSSESVKIPNPYKSVLQQSGGLVELLEKALLQLENITKTDYNQIFLITTGAYDNRLVAVADSILIHKQRYRIATLFGLLVNVAVSGKTLNAGRIRERPGYFQAVLT